jgi:hypothetical protein
MLKVRWEVPGNLPFPMPLEVRVDGKTVTLPMTNGTGETPAAARAGVTIDPMSKILRQSDGRPGHIFNLGHGVLPETPVQNVKDLSAFLRDYSAEAKA